MDYEMLADMKETNLKTNLIEKYIPNFGAAKDVHNEPEQIVIGEASEDSSKDVSEKDSLTTEQTPRSVKKGHNYNYKSKLRRRESIKQELLEGVDSDDDDEILDNLVKRVEEFNEQEKVTDDD